MSVSNQTQLIAEFTRLIDSINSSESDALAQIADFNKKVKQYGENEIDVYLLIMLFRDVTDWKSSYYVDWKDTSSLVASVNILAKLWQVKIDWSVSDANDQSFLNHSDTHQLLELAHEQFEKQGYRLWGYDTSTDSYGGWLAPISKDMIFLEISKKIDLDFYSECTGFSEAQLELSKDNPESDEKLTNWGKFKSAITLLPHVLLHGSFKTRFQLLASLLFLAILSLILLPIMLILKMILKILNTLTSSKVDD